MKPYKAVYGGMKPYKALFVRAPLHARDARCDSKPPGGSERSQPALLRDNDIERRASFLHAISLVSRMQLHLFQ